MKAKDNQLIFKCLNCNKDYNKNFNKELINRFSSTYKFCDAYIDETSLPNKENFYSSLNTEDTTDINYRHAKRVFKEL